MTWQDEMNASICTMLREDYGLDAVEVTGFESRTEWSGGCETCGWDEEVLDIQYTNSSGRSKEYTYSGNFPELLRRLT